MPQLLAGLEPHPARALDLQEERLDRVVDIDDLLARDGSGPVLDLGAREVGHDAAAIEPAAEAKVLRLGHYRGEVDHEQIVGRRVEGMNVRRPRARLPRSRGS